MHLALIVDCGPGGPDARLLSAREALEARGWETLVLRRDPDALVQRPAELLNRVADSDLTLLIDAPGAVAALVRAATDAPVLTVRGADTEDSRDRLVC